MPTKSVPPGSVAKPKRPAAPLTPPDHDRLSAPAASALGAVGSDRARYGVHTSAAPHIGKTTPGDPLAKVSGDDG